MLDRIWLIPVGFIIGSYGTLIGAGGGFVLVPMLILLYPQESPEVITSISLAVVFFNAFSGSIAYMRLKRVDYRSGILFAAATIPGAILGALTTSFIPRPLFDIFLGVMLIAASLFLIFHTHKPGKEKDPKRGCLIRNLIEANGTSHTFSYSPTLGIGLSLVVGYISSLLGIGGGIIHVPALVHLLNFPIHIATATSHFILAIMALTGTGVH
ncbi:MAG TPA: sulfite exporter TauE/SafE family protein, partial [Thermodesulfobacteriota bacterium]|nr:sulfite exporter TauE/SafE family protein [Thermodesulfobacteriota bacterium]